MLNKTKVLSLHNLYIQQARLKLPQKYNCKKKLILDWFKNYKFYKRADTKPTKNLINDKIKYLIKYKIPYIYLSP